MLNKNQKLSLEICIPAYNAEKNIAQLVESLQIQSHNNFDLKRITVYSDASEDSTVSAVKRFISSNFRVIDSKKRSGFADAVKIFLKQNQSDLLMMLNDDILIRDKLFIEKTILPFHEFENIGMVCSNPQPFSPTSFIEKAVTSGFRAYDKIKNRVREGNSVLTCDGKTMTLSRNFINSLTLPKNSSQMANVDGYLYFSCITKGFLYVYAKKAIIYFKCPSTVIDFVRWTIRNNKAKKLFGLEFGEELLKEYNVPFLEYNYYRFIEFIKNPFGCIVIAILGFYSLVLARINDKYFSPTWETIKTTKDLNLNL